jgi:hypothetical protein
LIPPDIHHLNAKTTLIEYIWRGWCLQVERRGRIPAHIFLDYALTYLVVGCIAALTLGQLGPSAGSKTATLHRSAATELSFTQQLQHVQDNWQMVVFAMCGGFCLAMGDLAIQYTTAFLGLSVGPPLVNALTIIVGVILSYFLDGGINNPRLVFPGMVCAAAAIALGAAAHVLSHMFAKHPDAEHAVTPVLETERTSVCCDAAHQTDACNSMGVGRHCRVVNKDKMQGCKWAHSCVPNALQGWYCLPSKRLENMHIPHQQGREMQVMAAPEGRLNMQSMSALDGAAASHPLQSHRSIQMADTRSQRAMLVGLAIATSGETPALQSVDLIGSLVL